MKLLPIICFGLMCFISSSFAGTCADISGTYVLDDQLVQRYKQKGCEALARDLGSMTSDGKVGYPNDPTEIKLDGTPLCDKDNKCEAAEQGPTSLDFSFNFDQKVVAEKHGICTFRKFSLSPDGMGNLRTAFSVTNCHRDRYSGIVQGFLLRYRGE